MASHSCTVPTEPLQNVSEIAAEPKLLLKLNGGGNGGRSGAPSRFAYGGRVKMSA